MRTRKSELQFYLVPLQLVLNLKGFKNVSQTMRKEMTQLCSRTKEKNNESKTL